MLRLLAALIACFALLIAGCGSDDGEPAAEDTPAAEETPAPNEFLPEGCENVAAPAPKEGVQLEAPKAKLSRSKTYVATVSTSCGAFEITLDAKRAPATGGSFKYLADEKFYDGLTFHRIVPEFVIQGGDPAGNGSGGPGYSVEEAPPSSLRYAEGVVAMAKTEQEPPGTSGSQFFVVTGAQGESLTPDYALVGRVTKGMDVVQRIGSIQSDQNTGQPAVTVVIESVTVAED